MRADCTDFQGSAFSGDDWRVTANYQQYDMTSIWEVPELILTLLRDSVPLVFFSFTAKIFFVMKSPPVLQFDLKESLPAIEPGIFPHSGPLPGTPPSRASGRGEPPSRWRWRPC